MPPGGVSRCGGRGGGALGAARFGARGGGSLGVARFGARGGAALGDARFGARRRFPRVCALVRAAAVPLLLRAAVLAAARSAVRLRCTPAAYSAVATTW